jgi:hypothetical protein
MEELGSGKASDEGRAFAEFEELRRTAWTFYEAGG